MDPIGSFHRLRGVLRGNAAFSATGGLIALGAFGPIDALLGTGNRPAVAATGVGLLGFALLVLGVAGLEPRRLLARTVAVSAADLAWVAATAVLIVRADLEAGGVALLIGVAATVATFAGMQLRLRAGAAGIEAQGSPIAERVDIERRVAATAREVWPLLTDHELYGRLAPNLSRVEVLDGAGAGMQRRCHDSLGRGWNETCTLWDDGHQFAVEVDTSDYPYPLAVMRGSWAVVPAGEGSTISMHFEFVPEPNGRGGVFAAVMLLGFQPVLRRILRGWERQLATRDTAPKVHQPR